MDAPAIIITPIALLPKELGEKEDFFSLFYHLIWQKYRAFGASETNAI